MKFFFVEIVNLLEFQGVTSKINLIKNLIRHCNYNMSQVFSWTPLSFVVDFDGRHWEQEVQAFIDCYSRFSR